ncbi:MAG: hypothetical protein U5L09_01875 [Bacteroidales bacterium]|nr:hypothetical protein [Bacteroidales bacterium]
MEQQNNPSPEVFFHAGMMRTASTFMQKTVFPELTGIRYISKKHYGKVHQIISQKEAEKYLVSFELNNALFYPHLKTFAERYPGTGVILVLRRHDQWITSHYKRAVKNGFHETFRKYFDIEDDTGRWKQEELRCFPKLEWVRTHFSRPPLILFHQELRSNPESFLNKILQYTGAGSTGNISFKPIHTSYSEKQLLFKRWVNHHTIFRERFGEEESKTRKFFNKTLRYILLNLPLVLPVKPSQQALVPEPEQEKIRKHFEKDWDQCKQFATEQNPV